MVKSGKLRTKSNQRNPRSNNKRINWKAIAIALYITFLLLSTIALTADRTIETKMQDSYTHHLRYPRDGRQTHYYVERVNTSKIGKIDLTYTTASNTLDVDCYNIKVLHIFCRSMYEDECRDVYGIDPYDNSNYYKWYFIEKNHFNVNIDSDSEIEELVFIDTPLACEVIVNDQKWKEDTDYFYTENGSLALSHVPSGTTRVDLYFKPRSGFPPMAILEASKTVVPIDYPIIFDASKSFDPDGTISAYIFDFGDGTFKGGVTNSHSYSKPGIYGVILTVRDNENLLARDYLNITVVKSSNLPDIQGIVPNQEKPEDSPPWTLNLTQFEPMASTPGIEFYWYLTGEDESLYLVTGENGTDNRLVFQPLPDAYGSDLVTIWLRNSENVTDSQPMWINITPVNDPPTIGSLPDLIIHYDEDYTFNYEPYVDDKETPRHELKLNIFDGYEENYISINGLNATYNYPQTLVGKIIYATVSVSDGETVVQDIITIQVTSNNVPKLKKTLPDVWLYEGTTKANVFDLDDYFMDPDNDAIYFSFGQSHLEIMINRNHTVDITAASDWTGTELVTFRARDPVGAIAEDVILVTVLPVNDPPTISGVPDLIIRFNKNYNFDLSPYVHDNDNSINDLEIIPSDLEHIRLDIHSKLVIIINYPEEYLGLSIPVRLTVFDGIDSGFQDITVTVTQDFPPELLCPLPDIVFLEDESLKNAFDLDNYFLDVDGDVLYYTTGNKYINITINLDHTIDFSAPDDWFGSEQVHFRATDPTGALQQDLVLVTVLPVNDAPFILEIPPQFGNESERWVLELEQYIFDVDNNLSELEINVDSDFIVVSGSSLIFLGSRELPNELELSVSDGEFTVTRIINIYLKVSKPQPTQTLWDLFLNILPFLVIIILVIIIIAGAIYRKKSKFTAEEVFLIHHGGTLITHLSRQQQANVDDVIFSGMFTAVQDFIHDTFVSDDGQEHGQNDQWALDELKLGDNNILIERSKHTYLAIIFSGEGSKRLRRIVVRLLGKIENKYSNILPKWEGNINELKGTKEILSVLIPLKEGSEQTQVQIEATPTPPTPMPIPKQQPIPQPKTILSSPLTTARNIKQQKQPTPSKELLKFIGKQTGVNKPGLTSWPMNKKQINHRINFGIERMPMALGIKSYKSSPKTIIIEKGQITINGKPKPTNSPIAKNLSMTAKAQPVTIHMPGGKKDFKIDPSRSLLQQLAEIEDKD